MMAEVVLADGKCFLLVDGLVCAQAEGALNSTDLMNIRDRINSAYAMKMHDIKAAGDRLMDISGSHAMQTYDRSGSIGRAIEAWKGCAP